MKAKDIGLASVGVAVLIIAGLVARSAVGRVPFAAAPAFALVIGALRVVTLAIGLVVIRGIWLSSSDGAGSGSLRISFVSGAMTLGVVVLYLGVALLVVAGRSQSDLLSSTGLVFFLPVVAGLTALVSGITLGTGLLSSAISPRWIALLAILVAVLESAVELFGRVIFYGVTSGRFGLVEFGHLNVVYRQASNVSDIVGALFWLALGVALFGVRARPLGDPSTSVGEAST